MDKNQNKPKLFKPYLENSDEEAESQSTSQQPGQSSGNIEGSEGATAASSTATAASATASSSPSDSTARQDGSNNNPSTSQLVPAARSQNPFGDNGPSTSLGSFLASEGEPVHLTLDSSGGRSRLNLSLTFNQGGDGGSDSESSSASIRVKCQDLIEATIDSCYSDQDSRDDQSTPSETSDSASREYLFGASSLGEADRSFASSSKGQSPSKISSKQCVTPPNAHGWRESSLDYIVRSGGSSGSSRRSSSSKRKAIPDDFEMPKSIGSSGNSSTVSSPTGFNSPSQTASLSPRTTNLESPRAISIARRTLNLDSHPPENSGDGSEQSSSSSTRDCSLKRRLLDAHTSEELASGISYLGISEMASHSQVPSESTGQSGRSNRSGNRFRHASGFPRSATGSAHQLPSDSQSSGSLHENLAGSRGLAQASPSASPTLSPTQMAGSMPYHSSMPHHQRILYEAYYSGEVQQPTAGQPLDLSRQVQYTQPVAYSAHGHPPSHQAAASSSHASVSRGRSRRQRHQSEQSTVQSQSPMQDMNQLAMLQSLLQPNRETLQPQGIGAQAFIFPPTEAHQAARGQTLPDAPSVVGPPPYQPRRSRSLSTGHSNPSEGRSLSTHQDAERSDDQTNF